MNGSVFSLCLEASLQGQAVVNKKGEFLFVNQAFCEQLGYSKKDLLLLSLESFIINDVEDELLKEEPMLKKGFYQQQLERTLLHGAGYLLTILFTVTDVTTNDTLTFHVQLDKLNTKIQNRNYPLLKAKLHERDEIKIPRKILDGIKDAIVAIRLDGQFLFANTEAERILTRKGETLTNCDFWSILKKSNSEKLFQKVYLLLAGEEYTELEIYKESFDEWYDVRAYRSDNQVIIYFINITVRKKMEKKLRENEMKFRSLVENTPETISIHDGKNLIYINPAGKKLFGIDEVNKAGLIFKAIVAEDHNRARENIRLLLNRKRKVTSSIYTLTKCNGEKLEVETTTTLIMYRGKTAFRTILKDISERKKMDDIIRKSDKLQVVAQLAAGVAHEIRNPLTTVKGFLQLFQKEQSYNPVYLSLVLEELVRVESIIFEYLTLARPNSEQEFKEIDVHQLVSQVLTLTKAQSNMNNVTVEFEYEQVPNIYGLEKKLKQVVINLLKNSIEAFQEYGTIHVRILNYPDKQVCIQVEDNGCGIAHERIERLGEPFYSTKEKGTGLGLMVCLKIIEHHNGVLNIYSRVGIGTRMEVIIPADNRYGISENIKRPYQQSEI